MMKRITMCADDFGMSTGVSQGIINLIELDRIHATSCLVNFPNWHETINQICNNNKIQIGLHLNFTEGNGLSSKFATGFSPLPQVLIKTHLRLYSKNLIKNEINCQLANFLQYVGRMPDYIDGHQHVHHLPVIQDALFEVINENSLTDIWIRNLAPNKSLNSLFKSTIIQLSKSTKFKANLSSNNSIYTNSAFAGLYSLTPKENFKQLMQLWLSNLPDRSIIMCHPSILIKNDKIDHATARCLEYNYLQSQEFIEHCDNFQVKLTHLQKH